jgi:hypothetical protein
VVSINKKKRLGFLQIAAAVAVIIVGIYSINLIVQKTDNTTRNIAVIEQKKLNLIDSNDIQIDNSKTKFDTLITNNNLSTQSIVIDTKQKGTYSITKNNNSRDTFANDNAEFAEAGGRIVLTDMYGKTVKTQMLSLGTNTIDINNLSKGFYLVNIITIDGKKTKKLIVE